ncbi:MAG: UDP-N-acetylenolpyruvoylglucosamine reductase [Pelagibacterales bacterium MED-G40]|nr:MAG: UDP-N-acetylenolpyruvoylglucosamine reductase [Candidatus Pelagibacter sp. TMED203]PDH19856.1 MAG: UDP-N-acetylenolpyruvoylglucosamine reductase [Pelagibacterales bacterium MED-G40]|tara:strand:- start:386 stop:1318 length:933 start_codon:yes stop_codon:yes gene_type:complete
MDERLKRESMKLKFDELKKIYGDNVYKDEILSKYSWFNLGGPSEIFFRPNSVAQLSSFLREVKKINKKITILGAGSNTLIRDSGVNGVTIKLGSKFSFLNLINDDTIHAGAATLDKNISNFARDNSLSNFEFLSCIPGSLGGGIVMNSGCYKNEISKILVSVEVIDSNGKIFEIEKNKINFFYRGCDLPDNLIILSAKLKGFKLDKSKIENKQNEFINKKKDSQPSQIKTCGSTFKNTKNFKAWELIKKSNCDKMFVGEAKISPKHCNFFVNEGNAKASEIEQLINKTKEKVFEKTGINLELEIKIIGER